MKPNDNNAKLKDTTRHTKKGEGEKLKDND
jgi:hypothetical protein